MRRCVAGKRWLVAASTLLMAGFATACKDNFSDLPGEIPPTLQSSNGAIAKVNVDIVAIDQWQNVQSRFAATFGLTPQDALKAVNQAANFETRAAVRSSQVGLGVEFDPTIISNTATTGSQSNTANGVTTETSSSTTNTSTQSATPASAPSTAPSGNASPVSSTSFGAVVPSLAPSIAYQAATALRNQVSVMDGGFGQIAPCGYVPMLVTLRVSIIPNWRNQPYDTFLDLSLLPGRLDTAQVTAPTAKPKASPQGLRPKLDVLPTTGTGNNSKTGVQGKATTTKNDPPGDNTPAKPAQKTEHDPMNCGYPVKDDDLNIVSFSSDSLENSQNDVLAQQTKALVLAAAVRAGTVAATASYQNLSEALDHSLSLRPNSLLSVGRIGKNTLHIRLGANRFGVHDFEMLPLEHDITVVLLAPYQLVDPSSSKSADSGDVRQQSGNEISAIGHYYFQDARPGADSSPLHDADTLYEAERANYLKRVAATIKATRNYQNLQPVDAIDDCVSGKDPNCTDLSEAAYSIPNSTLAEFKKKLALKSNDQTDAGIADYVALDIWQRLTKVSEYPGIVPRVSRRLPPTRNKCPPDYATFPAKDDGTHTVVTVSGADYYTGQTIFAELWLHGSSKDANGKYVKQRSLVGTFGITGNDIGDLTFPSFGDLFTKDKTQPVTAGIYFGTRDGLNCRGDQEDYYRVDYHQELPPKKEEKAAPAPAKTGVGNLNPAITRGPDGTATLAFVLTLADVKTADGVIVTATGTGDIVSIAPNDPKLGAAVMPKAGKVTLGTSGDYSVRLQNLSVGKPVSLTFQFQAKGKALAKPLLVKLTVGG